MNRYKEYKEREKQINEAVIQVFSFFDIFDYPLSSFEVWQYLTLKSELDEVQKILDSKLANSDLEFFSGFYFLPGRKKIIDTRKSRYNYANRKIKRAIRVAKLFRLIPWIRLIAVGNIIGTNNLRNNSDIDLFIITRPKRIWLTRFFCASLMAFLRLRPRPGKERDKICLSFYVSEKVYDLKKFMLDEGDLYFVYWLAGLVPVYNKQKTYEKFIRSNEWIKKHLPNWRPTELVTRQDAGQPFSPRYSRVFDLIFGRFEEVVEKIQQKKFPEEIRKEMNTSTCVVVDKDVIKLHTNDRRADFLSKLNTQLSFNKRDKITDLDKIIKDFSKKLPHFSDGRIDYSTSNEAPVLSCFVQYNDKILLLKRSNRVATYQNKWNTVAGYLDEEKSVREKALEEFEEELGISRDQAHQMIQGQPYKFFDENLKRTWIVYPVLVKLSQEPTIKLDWEHTEYKWVSPEEIKNYEVVPDLEISLRNTIDRYEIF